MKRRDLHRGAWGIGIAALVAIGAYNMFAQQACSAFIPGMKCEPRPELSAAILGIAGGALAILFQWRFEFVTSLREVWKACLEGYVSVRMLYRLDKVAEGDVQAALRAMSVAIDSVRSVYRNVGESETHLGYYPFASLHDIRLIVQIDHKSGTFQNAEKKLARAGELDAYWRAFRLHFLSEFNPSEPDRFIIKRRLSDTRKPDISLSDRIRLRLVKTEDLLTEDDLRL